MFDAKMDFQSIGPLAERAVTALESIAEHLGTLSRTAELQHQILTEHHPHREPDPGVAELFRRDPAVPRAFGRGQDNRRG